MNVDDYDFDELPGDLRSAAKKLGFTKEIWDNDGTPEDGYDDYDFDELPEDVKAAARKLGYTKEIWDNDERPQDFGISTGFWWVLQMLWPSICAHGKTASLLALVLTGHVLSTIALAISLEKLFDEAIPNEDFTGVLSIGLVLLGVLLVATLATFLQARWVAKLSAGIVYDLQRRIYEHILRLPPLSIAKTRSGDLLARFSTDMAPVAEAVGSGVPYLIMYFFVVVGSIGTIIWIDWRAGIGTLVLFGGGALVSRRLPKLASEATREFKEAESRALSVATESIRSHLLMNVFGLEGHFGQQFEAVAADQRKAQERAGYRLYLTEMLAEYGSMSLVALAIVAGAVLSIYGYVTPGSLVAIFTLLLYVQEGVYEMASAGSTLLEASGGLARIQELLDESKEDRDEEKPTASPLERKIHFEDVKLSLGEKVVLSNLTFSIKRGQHVAIVGRSGSGKSTLLRVLMRLLEPDAGRVTWDGDDVRALSRSSLRDQLGVVFQEPILIGSTLREVIGLGRKDVSDEEIEGSIRAAVLEDFVASLPNGLTSPLAEEGGEYSMGQKMRIALARALVRNPSVLLLDEVSASLDTPTEAQIIDTISDLSKEITVISVTHRLSVAQNADHIVVLDNGEIIEEGSHQELIKAGGHYSNLYTQQTAITSHEGKLQIAPDHLAKIPILSHLGEEKRVILATKFKTVRFSPGSTIIRQGEPAKEFFIIHRGKVEVLIGDETIDQLEDGEFFGEIGLLFDVPRRATLRALTPVSCLRLDRDDFERLVAGDDEIEKALLATARFRMSEPVMRRF
jgi:ATP-binding cassette subfamily B protein